VRRTSPPALTTCFTVRRQCRKGAWYDVQMDDLRGLSITAVMGIIACLNPHPLREGHSKESAVQKQVISAGRATVAAITAMALSLPIMPVAQAQQGVRNGTSTVKRCKIVDARPSRRCLNFRSDTTFPEGLSDYHGSGGR
jgi:hypothetical protein